MKLKFKKIHLLLALLMLFPSVVDAASYYGICTGAGVYIRSKAGTNGSILSSASLGQNYEMTSNTLYPSESKCPNGWYQIYYSGSKTGYICSDYLIVYEQSTDNTDGKSPSNECEVSLQQKGFPSSYWEKLCSIKKSHPNWEFNAVKNDVDGKTVDWNASVIAESSCGKNYTSSSNASYRDSSCTKTGDAGYYPVSTEAVKYYMDPRNFLNESNIFMFEGQVRNDTVSADSYKTASDKVFNNNFMIQQIPALTEYIKVASASTGVNQMALATRIYQELGEGKAETGDYKGQLASVLSGRYTTRFNKYYSDGRSFDNYYNFYNVGAYDGSGVTEKAMIYALKNGWGGTGNQDVDRQTAVTGGAEFLKNKYVSVGQDTIYFQKFNVFPKTTSSRYLNQYMTNISAPVSEASILYSAYKKANVLDSSFKFYIPVYSNMDSSAASVPDSSSSGNSNNPNNNLNSVSTIVNAAGFRYENGYISNIAPETNVNDIKSKLQSIGGSTSIVVVDENNNTKEGTIGTGCKIIINGSSSETLNVVIYGDTSGDGKINALDLLRVQKHILKTSELGGAYQKAADASKDGSVNALDLLKVQKHILGSSYIEQ